jgi:hypothetical protein
MKLKIGFEFTTSTRRGTFEEEFPASLTSQLIGDL